ncbi:MAG: hypothetical protein ACPLXM_14545 [Bacteroidales bacterium]
MTSIEYIKARLQEVMKRFPQLSFRYKYSALNSTHVIDVQPFELYSKNSDYGNWEAQFTYDFDNSFPTETVLFISDNSLTKIEFPDFVIGPSLFQFLVNNVSNISDFVFNNNQVESNYLLENEYSLAA